jgi:cyclophilin family peptidyl-prolyl cis-trans isomerase/HEAT repeat protein
MRPGRPHHKPVSEFVWCGRLARTLRDFVFRQALLVTLLVVAAIGSAQTPGGTATRQAFLWRALDSWSLPISQAVAMLRDPYPSVRAQAVGIMASNVDSRRLPLLARYMRDGDARVREQVMLAAGRMGEKGLALALHGLEDATPLVRQAAAWATAHGGVSGFKPLSEHLANERSREVAETMLANLWRFEEAPWQDVAARFAVSDDPFLRRAAAFSLSRTGDESARSAQRELAKDPEPVIRATALRGFERGDLVEKDLKVVQAALTDPDWRVRSAACRALAAREPIELSAEAAAAVASAFASAEPHLAVSALAAAKSQPAIGDARTLLSIVGGEDPWLAAEALSALVTRDATAAAIVVRSWFGSPELWRRRAAARVAVDLGKDAERLASTDADPSVRLAWLSTLDEEGSVERRELLLEMVEHDPDPAVRSQILSLLRSADAAPGIDDLVGLYSAWTSDEMPDARAEALVAALAAARSSEERDALIALGLKDRDPAVAAHLINGARSVGLDVALPAREPRHGKLWYEELSSWVREPHWLDISTERGAFRVRLDLRAAPLTSREISELAADGFYDGLEFHRIVPNFVVQGGDPRGDGWGGPGFTLPDEPSLVPFDSWRVGVATSGPETGGCQLFFTMLPADHLTGHYTNLGEIVAGREVVTSLRVGDTILSITPISGADPPPLVPPKAGQKRPAPEEPEPSAE